MTSMTEAIVAATTAAIPFTPFPSISRLSREMVVTEKLDGTNAQVHFTDDGVMYVGSRTRWITPEDDNYGFARWARAHRDELALLGPGSHFGEWWGEGIQRKYGMTEKRFSLFNTGRWTSPNNVLEKANGDTQCIEVPCCHVVPLLHAGVFDTTMVDIALHVLARLGSAAALGFDKPEGVVVYHEKSRTLFKKTLDKNDGHKGGA